MDLIQGSVRASCAFAVESLTLPFWKLGYTTDFQKDACLVAEKAITPSRRISGAVTVACAMIMIVYGHVR